MYLKLGQRRCYSTKVQRRNYSNNLPEFKCEWHYDNSDESKIKILNDNKGKSGIYMWTNKVNNKRYIGSSVDLRRRILEYFNLARLIKAPSMIINKALIKGGYSKFSLTILEYCNRKSLMEREKYYFDLLNPEYNILKVPGSPSRGSGWKLSEETKEKIRLTALNKSEELKFKLSQSNRRGQKIEVTDLKLNKKTEYHAIKAAALDLGISRRYIENFIHLNQTEPVMDRYLFKKNRRTCT